MQAHTLDRQLQHCNGNWSREGLCASSGQSFLTNIGAMGFRRAVHSQESSAQQGLHMLPCIAPSVLQVSQLYLLVCQHEVSIEPYHELLISIIKLEMLCHFGMGVLRCWKQYAIFPRPSQSQDINIAAHFASKEPWLMSGIAFSTNSSFPHFNDHRLGFAMLFDDAPGVMQTLIWHQRDQ